MQMTLQIKNFILYLLLCVLITAGLYTAPISTAVMAAQSQDSSAVLCAPGLSQSDDFLPEQVSSRRSAPTLTSIVRSTRTASSYRFMLLFLSCILTIMSVFANLIEKLIIFHDSRHLYEDNFIISFIQAIDGRKRIS